MASEQRAMEDVVRDALFDPPIERWQVASAIISQMKKSPLSPGIFVPTPPMKSRFPGANVVCDEVHALLPPLILSLPAAREGKHANLAEERVVVARGHFVLYPRAPFSGL